MRLVGLSLMVAVLAAELKKPVADRRWEGRLVGVVPYSLRFPTPERVWRSLWDPENPHLIVPRSFGVGWRLNLAQAAARMERLFRRLMPPPPAVAAEPAEQGPSPRSRSGQSQSRSRTNSRARP
jgi:hypothetical protein